MRQRPVRVKEGFGSQGRTGGGKERRSYLRMKSRAEAQAVGCLGPHADRCDTLHAIGDGVENSVVGDPGGGVGMSSARVARAPMVKPER